MPARLDSSNNSSRSNRSVYTGLANRIARLRFESFQALILLWLGARGYQRIRSLGRRSARGRRPFGGADFIAETGTPDPVRIAIQLRHWRTPVQRRAVDELRGVMLRKQVATGLIVASNVFQPQALKAAGEFPGRQIQLVSVSRLAGSMTALGLGVTRSGERFHVDDAFFRSLEGLSLGPRTKADKQGSRSSLGAPTPEVTAPPRTRWPDRLWLDYLVGAIISLILLLVAFWELVRLGVAR